MSHTPGPWFSDKLGNIWRRSPNELYENGGSVAGDKPLATVHVGWVSNGYPIEANKRLITTCPELLEALEIAREYVYDNLEERKQSYKGYPEKYRQEEADLAKIDAVIAKAKGENK